MCVQLTASDRIETDKSFFSVAVPVPLPERVRATPDGGTFSVPKCPLGRRNFYGTGHPAAAAAGRLPLNNRGRRLELVKNVLCQNLTYTFESLEALILTNTYKMID